MSKGKSILIQPFILMERNPDETLCIFVFKTKQIFRALYRFHGHGIVQP